MKIVITTLCLAFASLLAAQTADEAAIQQLCLKDTKAYVQRDFETWQSTWHHSEQASLLHTGNGNITQGWENIKQAMKANYEASTEPRPVTPAHSNFVFNIQGDRAFVCFEQTMTTDITVGGGSRVNKTFEVRNLVKVDGQWKIVNQVTTPMRHEGRGQDILDHLNSAAGMLERAERVDDAAKIAALAIDLYPNVPMGYWGMGYFAFLQKDKATALKHLEKAMALFDNGIPPSLQSLYEQAQALE